MTLIVRESPEHYAAIRQLTIDAFADSEFGYNGEADLIEVLRDQCSDIVSLVALDDQRVVGHVLFSPATIRTASEVLPGMGLAPMAVLPSHQRHGIGSMLVMAGLRRIDESDQAFTIVAGHRDYYPKFGFLPAHRFSITHGFIDLPQDILFVRLRDGRLAPDLRDGLAYFHAAFGPQHVG